MTSVDLTQWFLTLLEVLNPTSSIHAFIEPFVVGKIKCVAWILFYFYFYRSKPLAAEPLKLTHRTQVKNYWILTWVRMRRIIAWSLLWSSMRLVTGIVFINRPRSLRLSAYLGPSWGPPSNPLMSSYCDVRGVSAGSSTESLWCWEAPASQMVLRLIVVEFPDRALAMCGIS